MRHQKRDSFAIGPSNTSTTSPGESFHISSEVVEEFSRTLTPDPAMTSALSPITKGMLEWATAVPGPSENPFHFLTPVRFEKLPVLLMALE